ncbi:MAG: GNAT family N-acetyltransferase [Alteraurantiacibacter sp.]
MTTTSYHDTVKDVQDLDWPDDRPFARPGWFALLERSDLDPVYATVRGGERTLCLPLQREDDTLASLTNWYAFTWEPIGDTALLPALAEGLRGKVRCVALAKLPKHAAHDLSDAFREAGWITDLAPADTNHILHLTRRDYATYLASRPGKLRTTLKRKTKKVRVRIADNFDPADWKTYEAIYAASWKPEEGDPALLRRFAEMESTAGRYRLGIADHEGEPIAVQFWTVDHGTAYIHKLAHLDSAKPLSPGTTLTAALMEHVIDTDGVDAVDFGTGDDPYKRDWMKEVRIRWHLICIDPRRPANWPRIAKLRLRTLVSRDDAG